MSNGSAAAPILQVEDLQVSFTARGRAIEAVKGVSFSLPGVSNPLFSGQAAKPDWNRGLGSVRVGRGTFRNIRLHSYTRTTATRSP